MSGSWPCRSRASSADRCGLSASFRGQPAGRTASATGRSCHQLLELGPRRALPSYAASKGAVDAISLILAGELRGRNITVNAVAPGATATDMFLDGRDPETIARVAGTNPLGRIGRPDDIAEVVSFLAGAARWINGQTIHVNGGAV